METISNVLIKEVSGSDKVFIVDNLPKELLFTKVKKMVHLPIHAIDYHPTRENLSPAYTLRNEDMPDEPRNRRMTGEMVDELLPGIEYSQTGDSGFTFFTEYNEANERLKAIDRYIVSSFPPLTPVPKRVEYAAQPGSFTSSPKPLSQIPRVVLPVAAPVSPPVNSVQEVAQVSQPVVLEKQKERKKVVWTEEMKKAAGERLRLAREAKKAQPTV